MLGADQYNAALENSRQLDRAVGAAFDAGRAAGRAIGQDPGNLDLAARTAGYVGRRVGGRLRNSTAEERGRFAGRAVTSIVLSPIGFAASLGDFLTGVERQGPSVDTALDFVLFGGQRE